MPLHLFCLDKEGGGVNSWCICLPFTGLKFDASMPRQCDILCWITLEGDMPSVFLFKILLCKMWESCIHLIHFNLPQISIFFNHFWPIVLLPQMWFILMPVFASKFDIPICFSGYGSWKRCMLGALCSCGCHETEG